VAVREIDSLSIEPYEDGASFGPTGPYEVVRAVLRYSVDPTTDAGRRIVDLEHAARDAHGTVAFESDLIVLRPVDPAAGNRGLLYSVANRGSATSLPLSIGAFAIPGVSERIEPGDGFLLRRGYSVAWSGWQWDVVRRPGMVGLAAPEALGDDGAPIAGPVRVRVQPAAPTERVRLGGLALDPSLAPPLPYPPADLDNVDAVLTVQNTPDGDATPIDRASWKFVDPDHIALDGGFEAGRIYEVTYRTARCPVAGTGFLAVRDAVSWLRHADQSDGNPLAGRVDFALATGASQSGRFLRHFLSDAMNVDEDGRPVFDGVHIHIAGGRRGEFNSRYAQPGVIWRGPGDVAPYATNALLERQRAIGGAPKVIATNSAAEYWRGDAWLAHGDGATRTDVEDAPDVRHYLLAGVDHVGELGLMMAGMLLPALNPPNGLVAAAPERALVMALEQWVRDGTAPPPSRVPRLDDGTAIDRADALAQFAVRPDVPTPTPDALPIGRDDASVAIVSALDEGGNEIAGVRLPQLVEPVAIYTGWNVRPPSDGLPDLMPDFLGSRIPCSERSVRERYADHADYEARARDAARELVAGRYLLEDDVERVVADAVRVYDESLTGGETGRR
jgi:hypothetical protein